MTIYCNLCHETANSIGGMRGWYYGEIKQIPFTWKGMDNPFVVFVAFCPQCGPDILDKILLKEREAK